MLQTIEFYTAPFYVFATIIPGIITYKHLLRPYRIIFWFALFSFVINGTSIICSQGFHLRTTGFIHLYTVFEFVFLSVYFAEIYGPKKRNIIYGLATLFVLFCIANTLFWQSTMIMNSYTRSVGAIILIGYSLVYFFKQDVHEETIEWSSEGLNWITAGLLLYYSCSLFMFIFFNYLLVPSTIVSIIWDVHNLILLIEYILFAIGFYKCRSRQITLTY
ncbi:hypothetical protein DYU05_00135 [Mucilaginibacter terrenus]|uniref:Uncharacterized protein n=1 Tax=Mucilaginibacter terrenus TaxID=2482727 RepID=A0A3E2NSW4_9SPHI|nr:hypothetical protein [Mucilaginibacter terrenus]RFZ84084.1 hypothetical protein DYU05_00135 [Mucilaginibacter terrenus]